MGVGVRENGGWGTVGIRVAFVKSTLSLVKMGGRPMGLGVQENGSSSLKEIFNLMGRGV